jgi:hypothetical protein
VQIIINTPFLEVALGQAFPHLRQVRVVRAADLGTVVRAAASYIDRPRARWVRCGGSS